MAKPDKKKSAPQQEPPTEEEKPRRRGRPKGSKNKTKRAKKDPISKKAPEFIQGTPEATQVEQVKLSEIDLSDEAFKFRIDLKTKELAPLIQEHGQQVPVILRRHPDKKGTYQIISGFRRISAIQEIGWETVDAIIRQDLALSQEDSAEEKEQKNKKAFELSVIENEARKTYTDLERGYAIVQYRERGHAFDDLERIFKLTKRQLARLQSLTSFPRKLQEAIAEGAITATHALAIQSMRTKYGNFHLERWVERIQKEKMSVRELQQAITLEMEPKREAELYNFQEQKNKSGEIERKITLRAKTINIEALDKKERTKIRKQLKDLLELLEEEENDEV